MTSIGAAEDRALLDLLERMWLIRAFEEKVSDLYARGHISGLLHLGIGQEGSAVGACSILRDDDYVLGSHRAHAHALAKGADPERLMAELAGRSTGYCAGKGGSMHLVALECGFVTATGVVAGSIPLGLGTALAGQQAGMGQVTVVFFGDGAGQAGPFHESLNLASLWKLPLVFLCENNGYAEFTPLSAHTNIERLTHYADTYQIPSTTVEGNDVLAVQAATEQAVELARSGGGPSFIEALTHRPRGHYEGDQAKYRELSEREEWKEKDPIARFEMYLEQQNVLSEDASEARTIEADVRQRIEAVAEAALDAPWPAPESLTSQVLAS